MDYTKLASNETIQKTIAALKANGIEAMLVSNGAAAKEKLFELLPQGAEVMNMTSVTLETISAAKEIVESGRYNSIRKKFMSMDRKSQGLEMQRLGAAPEWVVGSVHAVTQNGEVMIASNTGSQLPAYAYGSSHVIWVVGAQKIVKDREQGFDRIYTHSLPLEAERAKKAYGVAGSFVSKILVIAKEVQPNRITMILVNEVLGF